MAKRFRVLSGNIVRAARFAAREPTSALILLRMASWVAATSVLLKLLSFERAMAFITPRRRRAQLADPAQVQQNLSRLIDLLLALNVGIYTPTCWKRAPVLHRFLWLSGVETQVVFGVKKMETGTLDGHAWLEANGQPLLEKSFPDYKVTFSYPVGSGASL